ncbi:DEAD/DEAH box helicase [Alkalithermobacter paradoxus]|uniref:DEAD-box ATP-dependent RNA helicase CshA n=1 Tax=Alkalithermobacter paradoxus TaxID=29349 RepID=A0A1V4IAQ2_9FIRM|nr:DEAD-box ATP-dependent RNA helicase CshA [[Clostridium] thermoalcaliphilum]
MNKTFDKLGIDAKLVQALSKLNITSPTNIQEKVIPVALENKDVIGKSETGTGKTLAYLLPTLQKIDTSSKDAQAIVLTPTHELSIQVQRVIDSISKNTSNPVRSALIVGNVNIRRQLDRLKEKPHIIVGTSGRILELINLRKIKAHTIKTIVIDEVDRLLDKYNIDNVKAIIKATLRERQILAFSATINEDIINISKEIMQEPEFVEAQEKQQIPSKISHMYFSSPKREKIEVLRKLIRIFNPQKAIVFINNSYDVEVACEKLRYHKLNIAAIHGNFIKKDRKRVMEEFKKGNIQVLIASDIGARGLDIKGVTHIFNVDIPEDPNNYLHRVGRSARAGESGIAVSIVSNSEKSLIARFERYFNIKIAHKYMYMGKIFDVKNNNKK